MKKSHSGLAFLAGLGVGVGLSTFIKVQVAKKKAEGLCECDCDCEEEITEEVDAMETDGLEEWGVEQDDPKTPTEYDMVNEDVTEEVKEKVTTPIEDEKLDQFLAEANLEEDKE